MVYPAGIHDPNKGYSCSDNCVPYVQDNETKKYYVLIKNVPKNNNIAVTNTEYWEPMETFNSVFTDLIVAKYGNIGGAVYYTQTSNGKTYEFMISKTGKSIADYDDDITNFMKTANGDTVTWDNDYDMLEAIKQNSIFIPAILLCFTTGDA